MIARYRLSPDGTWLDKATGKPMVTPDIVVAPRLTRDLPTYKSPITGKPIDGRAARREDLKRSGSREVDPSEFKVTYESKTRAIANGGEHEPRAAVDLGNGYRRGGTA
jgi:hypothetical protein